MCRTGHDGEQPPGILDTLGIHYEVREYEVDPDDLSAEHVARDIGMPPDQVSKTLVARGDRHGVLLAVVPANSELDFKTLARQNGNRTVELVSLNCSRLTPSHLTLRAAAC